MRVSAPVIASNPVASTSRSSSTKRCVGADAGRGDLLDRVLAQIDEGHVVAVEGLEVARVQHGTLASERVAARRERLGDIGILHRAPHHLTEQLDGHLVGLEIGRGVGPDAARAEPVLLERGFALLGGALEDAPFVGREGEDHGAGRSGRAAERRVLLLAELAVPRLHRGLVIVGERPGSGTAT